MAYNSDILEAITKLSVEFNNKLDNLYFELNSIKQSISTLNSKITDTSESINSTIIEINTLLKNIESNNNPHLTSHELQILSRDLKFLVIKIQETEKHLFDIKYLSENRKNI